MRRRLRILSVEDDPQDTELIQSLLEAENIDCEVARVDTEAGLLAALGQGGIDLILADYTLPSFDGISALKLAQKVCPEIPFLFVSGTLGEEVAIEALKIGATDYVVKTRLSRLAPSVMRALREAETRVEQRRAEEKLRRSEAYLAEAQDLSHTGSFGWNVPSGELYWSHETFRILEFDPNTRVHISDVMGRTYPEDRQLVQQVLQTAIQQRSPIDFEHRLLMPDGRVKHVKVVGRPVIEGHDVLEFIGAVSDITDLKQKEQALRRSEGYLAEAQRLTRTGSWVWEVNGRVPSYLSDEWYRIYGFDPTEGAPGWELRLQRAHPLDRERWHSTIERAIRDRSDYEVEFRILLPDGTVKWIHTVGHPLFAPSGELQRFVGSSTDITERKNAEEALRRSEGYLAEAQKLSRSGSWAWSVATREVFWSREMYRIFGYDPDKTKPTLAHFLRRVHPADLPSVQARVEREATTADQSDAGSDFRIVLEDGTIRHLHSLAHSIVNEEGQITEVVGTTMDVTEQHLAKTALETAFQEIQALKDQLYRENIALREEIDRSSMFEEIVGESAALQEVLGDVLKVAPTESTVLITGETGTGKELIARAIHKRSQRAGRAFVSVNCAAIPPSLIASELFGHEKGAFTGATQRRLGRFELAEGGTIFLDEIGELPSDVQITLLRVLQERVFERVGSSKEIHANVRVIAATNRNLPAAIEAGNFRKDLYYRLNVFPIDMPPLRKRKEDIPLLVGYFIDRYASRAGKKIRSVNRASMDKLSAYSWPGNIRELQNVIERSVVVCETENFTVDERWLTESFDEQKSTERPVFRMTASEEKKVIEDALAEAQGRISGPLGAAARLGLPPSTLDSKIKVLKINKHRFRASS